jgi:hypothetical protein
MNQYWHGRTSNIVRVKVHDVTALDNAGLTGLDNTATGLVISTIADVEATATAYTVAGSTVETIGTLGTFAAPTATKCRFAEVDVTNHPGVYELHIADARFAVAGASALRITLSGATNMAQTDIEVPLPTPTYYAAITMVVDDTNSKDEYVVVWYRDGATITTGVTSPTLDVDVYADGSNLFTGGAESMTEIASLHAFKYTESTDRTATGQIYVATAAATIDGATRISRALIRRDDIT